MDLLSPESLLWLVIEPNIGGLAILTLLALFAFLKVNSSIAQLTKTLNSLTQIPNEIRDLKDDLAQLRSQREVPLAPLPETGSTDGRLDCVDAKLLELSKMANQLQVEIQQANLTTALEELRANSTITHGSLQDSAERVIEFQEALKRRHVADIMRMLATKAESSKLEEFNRTVQQNLLDILKKLSTKVETTELADMNRLEKQGLSEKLVKIDASCERLQDLCKTQSNEIHVCKTVVERKVDAVAKDLTSHVGWSQTRFRPMFPMIPILKWLQDSTKDVVDHLARNHTAVEGISTLTDQLTETLNLTRKAVTNLGEVLESQEQRIERVEGLVRFGHGNLGPNK